MQRWLCAPPPHSADNQVRAREALRLAPHRTAADSARYAACASQRHAITGHASVSQALALQAQGGGRLTDGMGSGGHYASFNGQDYAVVQAAAGQLAQLDLLVLWLSPRNNVRVTVDGGEETLLRGTVLPPPEGGGRRFRSKAGGTIQVLLVTDDPGSLSFVSLAVSAACHAAHEMVVWNATVGSRPGVGPCNVPSPTDFEYPSSYIVQPMRSVAGFGAAADAWSEGRDDLSVTGIDYKYWGGVLLPDGRVVLVPDGANHVGLYDPS
eukprot:COSAG02_NODE_3820_length_6190_cov_1.860121_1_plen_266_part_10